MKIKYDFFKSSLIKNAFYVFLNMLQKFKTHIKNNLTFLTDKKLLLTVSGGVDSVVLTQLMHQLGYTIHLAHCNFQLRDQESEQDCLFVEQLANQLQCPFHIIRFDTKAYAMEQKLSIQMAARKLRYDWFEALLSEHQLDYILTGHHADDNLETFLINMIRGTGLDGLQGIPAHADNRVRPLLPFSREEIIAYATENQITWREDSSNASTKYLRNKLRHDVIPVLKELNLNLLDSFQETISHLQQSQAILTYAIEQVQNEVVSVKEDYVEIDLKKIKKYPNPNAYLYRILKVYGFTSWKDIYELIDAQSGKQILSDQYHMVKSQNTFLIKPREIKELNNPIPVNLNENEINHPVSLAWEITDQIVASSLNTIYVDANLLHEVYIRKWEDGDVFYPFGMKGKKKRVSKYFKELKMSLFEKQAVWLLCSGDDIVWIVGHRQDERFKITDNTQRIMKINYYEI